MPMTTSIEPVVSEECSREIAHLFELVHRVTDRVDMLRRGQVEPDEDISMFAVIAADAIYAEECGTPLAETAAGEDADYIMATLRVLAR